ncbi:hypothetical protein L0128_18030 [candidate division KSB1 bacterium]|nr:hypothetical protein [candidate division KSB1 bacterium]
MRSLTIILLIFGFCSFLLAQTPVTFEYRLEKGKTYQYNSESTSKMTQEMMGQSHVTEVVASSLIKLVVLETASNGDLTCHASFEKMQIKISSPQMDSTLNLGELCGKRSQVIFNKYGKTKEIVQVDSLPAGGGMMRMLGIDPKMYLRRLLMDLPEKALAPTETWTASRADTMQVMGNEMVVVPQYTYTISGRETVGGHDCVKLAIAGPFSVTGKGSQRGMEFFIEGDGKIDGMLYFADKIGVMVAMETTQEQQMSIAITGGANMTIAQNVSTKNKVTLVP